jgi:predicted transcriptional regulator
MSGITDSENQLNILWRRKEPKNNNTQILVSDLRPERISESTLEGYLNKLIQKEVNACTQKVLFLELLC